MVGQGQQEAAEHGEQHWHMGIAPWGLEKRQHRLRDDRESVRDRERNRQSWKERHRWRARDTDKEIDRGLERERERESEREGERNMRRTQTERERDRAIKRSREGCRERGGWIESERERERDRERVIMRRMESTPATYIDGTQAESVEQCGRQHTAQQAEQRGQRAGGGCGHIDREHCLIASHFTRRLSSKAPYSESRYWSLWSR